MNVIKVFKNNDIEKRKKAFNELLAIYKLKRRNTSVKENK